MKNKLFIILLLSFFTHSQFHTAFTITDKEIALLEKETFVETYQRSINSYNIYKTAYLNIARNTQDYLINYLKDRGINTTENELYTSFFVDYTDHDDVYVYTLLMDKKKNIMHFVELHSINKKISIERTQDLVISPYTGNYTFYKDYGADGEYFLKNQDLEGFQAVFYTKDEKFNDGILYKIIDKKIVLFPILHYQKNRKNIISIYMNDIRVYKKYPF